MGTRAGGPSGGMEDTVLTGRVTVMGGEVTVPLLPEEWTEGDFLDRVFLPSETKG